VQAPECPRCRQTMAKQVSLFATVKSEDARADELSDPSSFGDLDEDDLRSVARWARQMQRQTGEDMGPEFDTALTRIESGEDPDRVMDDLEPSFGAGGDAGDDGDSEFA